MGSLLIVTGPPGAGKSTVAAELAQRWSPSVLVAGDAFFGFLAAGAIPPWLPESATQNRIVTEAMAQATGHFARHYDTVFDGVLGPWFVPTFAGLVGLASFDYAILLPTVEVCLYRVQTRIGHGFDDPEATRKMHDEFTRGDVEDRHLIPAVDDADPAAMADAILAARAAGQLRFEVD